VCEQPPRAGDELRYEIKLPLFNRSVGDVAWAIRRHPFGFREVYPPRLVNNLYFETPGLDCFYTSISGASDRYKVRLRWYEDAQDPILQWKWRRAAVGFKWTVPVELHQFDDAPTAALATSRHRRELRRLLASQVSPLQRRYLRELPLMAVLNRYRRRYFESAIGSCRLTVDDGIVFAALPSGASAAGRGLVRCPRLMVVELKARASQRATLQQVLQGISYRPARYSKYAAALRYFLGSVD
jgi:hypothetical protein